MLTYVINTSENRTLDSDKLFELTGYNKIRWLNCPLSEVAVCAQHIFEKQNVIGSEEFRIAVLVDFFGFDRIRVPYGRRKYVPETGVDISLYLPFIETYLLDNLIAFLENRELFTSDFEIYYVQNTKLDRYDFLNNEEAQLRQILSGGTPAQTDEVTGSSEPDGNGEDCVYTSFDLYCTENVSLNFDLKSYPYGSLEMTFSQFLKAFSDRISEKYDIRRHYYISNYGGGMARAALDSLTLSLYLIYTYEREESSIEDEEIEIGRIDAQTLKDVLINAWTKICLARDMAKGNDSLYYSLKENIRVDEENLQPKTESGMEVLIDFNTGEAASMHPIDMYEKVCYYHNRTREQIAKDKRAEFDRLMNEYLVNRDSTKQTDVEAEIAQKMNDGSLITTRQFPSKEEYLHIAKQKQEEISARFDNVLSAAYREVDFTEEKNRADVAYKKFCHVKKCMHRNIIGDLIFMILAIAACVGPYILLQLSGAGLPSWYSLSLGIQCAAVFLILFAVALSLQISILALRMKKAKKELRDAYFDAYKKECDSLASIRARYNEDLLYIERTRYELRQLKFLYELNMAKDANVMRHRKMLEELEDHLGSILNHLDIEPILDPEETVSDEFDMTKPIRAKENKVYRIFSLDVIEKLFSRKGRDET